MTAEFVEGRGSYCLQITGATSTANAGLGSVENPEGVPLVITNVALYIVDPSTGSATLSVGCGASGAASTSLINALTVNGSLTGKAYNGLNPSAKSELDVWAADEYLNITGSADTTGLDAYLFVEYLRAGQS